MRLLLSAKPQKPEPPLDLTVSTSLTHDLTVRHAGMNAALQFTPEGHVLTVPVCPPALLVRRGQLQRVQVGLDPVEHASIHVHLCAHMRIVVCDWCAHRTSVFGTNRG